MTHAPAKPLHSLGRSLALYAGRLEDQATLYRRTAGHLQRRTMPNTRLWRLVWSVGWGMIWVAIADYFLRKVQRRFERVELVATRSEVDDLTR